MKAYLKLYIITPLLLVSFVFGFLLGNTPVTKKVVTNSDDTPTKTEVKKETREFPPDFWGDYYEDEIKDWNIYISNDNEIAFKYPKELSVYQNDTDGNIFLFPTERAVKGDFDMGRGFSVIILKYGDGEYNLEDGMVVTSYSPYEFRLEDYYDDLSGVTFFNKATGSYITKAETPLLGYGYIYNVYKNEDEMKLGKMIIGTIANDKRFELHKYHNLSSDNRKPVTPGINYQTELVQLKISLNLPLGYSFKEVTNEDGRSTRASIDKGYCSLQISDNPEYVGFSTSGSLCANRGLNTCNYYKKYFIPEIGNSMTIVSDVWEGKIRGYRGVAYSGNSGKLSASMVATDKNCIKELLGILYSINPQ